MLRIFFLMALGVTVILANHVKPANFKIAENSNYVASRESLISKFEHQLLSRMSDINERKRRSPQDLPNKPPPMPMPEMPGGRRRRSVYPQEMKELFTPQDQNLRELFELNSRWRRSPQDMPPLPLPMPPMPMPPMVVRRRRSPEDIAQKVGEKKELVQAKVTEAMEQGKYAKEKAKNAGEAGKEAIKEKVPPGMPGK